MGRWTLTFPYPKETDDPMLTGPTAVLNTYSTPIAKQMTFNLALKKMTQPRPPDQDLYCHH